MANFKTSAHYINFLMDADVPAIAEAINKAYVPGIIIVASASNERAITESITFPARLNNVFCIGAADGKEDAADYKPPFFREKYSALVS